MTQSCYTRSLQRARVRISLSSMPTSTLRARRVLSVLAAAVTLQSCSAHQEAEGTLAAKAFLLSGLDSLGVRLETLDKRLAEPVDIVLAILLILGGVFGAQFGARAGRNLRAELFRFMLALLLLAVGVRFALELIVRPNEPFSITVQETRT